MRNATWLNTQITGLLIGLAVPVLTSLLIYNIRFHGGENYYDFLVTLFNMNTVGKLLSLSALPNLLVFFIAIWKEKLMTARGVLMATVIYTLVAVVLFLIK
jgi:hypothetical protein